MLRVSMNQSESYYIQLADIHRLNRQLLIIKKKIRIDSSLNRNMSTLNSKSEMSKLHGLAEFCTFWDLQECIWNRNKMTYIHIFKSSLSGILWYLYLRATFFWYHAHSNYGAQDCMIACNL